MAKPLVIVESPAKAKTIAKFLGNGYDVRASVGHVSDLPSKGLSIDVDNGFKPTYELTERGKQVVKELRVLVKDASELYLATDEDREGEAISWHLLEYLKPKIPVRRMVFHEITKTAIDAAVANPRGIDYGPRRRRRDPPPARPAVRLRGLAGAVAAGQPGPVRRARAVPVGPPRSSSASASGSPSSPPATGTSTSCSPATATRRSPRTLVCDRRHARSPPAGTSARHRRSPAGDVVVVDESGARSLTDAAAGQPRVHACARSRPSRTAAARGAVHDLHAAAGGRPQAAARSAQQVMRIAQRLYEHGYITYMRTDNVVLSSKALERGPRAGARALRPPVPTRPSRASTSARSRTRRRRTRRSARPATPAARPRTVASELSSDEFRLYRTDLEAHARIADGRCRRHRRSASSSPATSQSQERDVEFAASSGTTITFPGYRQVYVESTATARSPRSARRCCRRWPRGRAVPSTVSSTPNGHTTSAAGAVHRGRRWSSALEELGIGRPVDLGVDHPDRAGPRLRVEEGPGAGSDAGPRSRSSG